MPTTLLLHTPFLLKPPPPTLIQPQRILPRLFFAANLLRPAITVLVLAAHNLHALVFVAEQGADGAACSAAERIAQGACDAFFERGANGAESGSEDFSCLDGSERLVEGRAVVRVWGTYLLGRRPYSTVRLCLDCPLLAHLALPPWGCVVSLVVLPCRQPFLVKLLFSMLFGLDFNLDISGYAGNGDVQGNV
jgi:hypothetical protein